MVEHASARILVVDDDTASRMTLDVVLFCAGYDVATAANAEEALGWFMQREFDLVLIEPTLPGMSAFELARHARTCQPGARVIFYAAGDATDVLDAVGDVDYLRALTGPDEVVYLMGAAPAAQPGLRLAA